MEDINSKQAEYDGQTFKKVNLQNDTLTDKTFYDCTFVSCNFSSAIIWNCKFIDCDFTDCNLSTIDLKDSAFRGVTFKDCKMIGINWTSASWPNIQTSSPINFDECKLDNSIFFGLYLQEIKMEACHVHDANFTEADCKSASFIQSDFTNSLFSDTDLSQSNFVDASNYSIDVFNNKIKGAKFSLPEAKSLLAGLDIEVFQ